MMTIHIDIFLIQLRCLFFADEAEAPNKIVYADWLNNNYGYLDGEPLPGSPRTVSNYWIQITCQQQTATTFTRERFFLFLDSVLKFRELPDCYYGLNY